MNEQGTPVVTASLQVTQLGNQSRNQKNWAAPQNDAASKQIQWPYWTT